MKEGYKQTEIGVIPEDWEIKSLNEIAPLQRGFDLPYSQMEEGKYPVVFSNGVGAFHNAYMAKGPGVITGRSGTIGKVHYISTNYWPHNTTLWVTDFHGNDEKYVYYLFQTVPWELFNSGSSVPTLNRNDVHDTLHAIPPRPEQRRIAEALSDMDEQIASMEKLSAKKKAIKQGAMQELLTGKRRLPGFSGEWERICLSEIGHFIKGSGISRADASSGKLPAVRYGELYTKHDNYVKEYYSHISFDVAQTAVPVTYGAILFAASGETKEEIGKCAAIIDDHIVYAGGDILIFMPDKPVHPVFWGTLLNTPEVCKQKAQWGQGDAIVHIHVTIPDYEEQAAIADVLLSADREIDLLETQVTKARQIKQGMMQQLLTGTIRLS